VGSLGAAGWVQQAMILPLCYSRKQRGAAVGQLASLGDGRVALFKYSDFE
jgi:hypothetical protein